MAKVRFSQDFNWIWPAHHGLVSTMFKAGRTYTVKRDCADEAVARGVATEVGAVMRKALKRKAASYGESTD